MTPRTVILGLAAPYVEGLTSLLEPAWSPAHRSTRRLAELAGVEPYELADHFGLENVCPIALESFTSAAARSVLARFGREYEFRPGRRYVLAGYQVARALGRRAYPLDRTRDERPLLEWYTSRGGVRMAILPHPSGMNRWYNHVPNRWAAVAFLRRTMRADRLDAEVRMNSSARGARQA